LLVVDEAVIKLMIIVQLEITVIVIEVIVEAAMFRLAT
jgi:hypothetical protein